MEFSTLVDVQLGGLDGKGLSIEDLGAAASEVRRVGTRFPQLTTIGLFIYKQPAADFAESSSLNFWHLG